MHRQQWLARLRPSARCRVGFLGALLSVAIVAAGCVTSIAATSPGAATSSGIAVPTDSFTKQIQQRGVLRVGVLALPPWLLESSSGQYSGEAWTLAEAVAKYLHVKLQLVPVSQETKVSDLQTGVIDISITPLADTPQRLKVIDFVNYSYTADCFAGFSTNPKLKGITKVSQLNSPKLSMAYFIGGSQQDFLPKEFPQLRLVGVTGSGSGVPLPELLSGRADLVVFNVVEWPALKRTYPTLEAWPTNCIGSTYQSLEVGWGVAKGHPEFVAFLRKVEVSMQSQLNDELRKDEALAKCC
jgi:polar amino acid transport system substrate-binding protein